MTASAAFAETVTIRYMAADEAAFGVMRDAAYEITKADDAFVAEVTELLKPVEQEWIDRAKANGVVDPAALPQAFRDEIAAESGQN